MIKAMRIIILVTAGNKKEAKTIALGLIKQRLAACVNIIDRVDSLFFWEAKTERAKECLLIIKSGKEKLPRIIKLVRSLHSYKVPEIIALPIIGGSQAYLRWLDASVR